MLGEHGFGSAEVSLSVVARLSSVKDYSLLGEGMQEIVTVRNDRAYHVTMLGFV